MTNVPLVTTISKEQECVTLVNTFFTPEPQDQDEVIKVLTDLTKEVMRYQPGFISANIHRSQDGSTVLNYAQWRSTEHWKAAIQKPEIQEHTKLVQKYTKKPTLYQVVYVSHAGTLPVSDRV
jgi:quinol monooxygenase YgiN